MVPEAAAKPLATAAFPPLVASSRLTGEPFLLPFAASPLTEDCRFRAAALTSASCLSSAALPVAAAARLPSLPSLAVVPLSLCSLLPLVLPSLPLVPAASLPSLAAGSLASLLSLTAGSLPSRTAVPSLAVASLLTLWEAGSLPAVSLLPLPVVLALAPPSRGALVEVAPSCLTLSAVAAAGVVPAAGASAAAGVAADVAAGAAAAVLAGVAAGAAILAAAEGGRRWGGGAAGVGLLEYCGSHIVLSYNLCHQPQVTMLVLSMSGCHLYFHCCDIHAMQ